MNHYGNRPISSTENIFSRPATPPSAHKRGSASNMRSGRSDAGNSNPRSRQQHSSKGNQNLNSGYRRGGGANLNSRNNATSRGQSDSKSIHFQSSNSSGRPTCPFGAGDKSRGTRVGSVSNNSARQRGENPYNAALFNKKGNFEPARKRQRLESEGSGFETRTNLGRNNSQRIPASPQSSAPLFDEAKQGKSKSKRNRNRSAREEAESKLLSLDDDASEEPGEIVEQEPDEAEEDGEVSVEQDGASLAMRNISTVHGMEYEILDEMSEEERDGRGGREGGSEDSEVDEDTGTDKAARYGPSSDLEGEGDDMDEDPNREEPAEINKVILVEKMTNRFDFLPDGWLAISHRSGMPVYLHKQSRACTLSRPYFLGPGSARNHDIPLCAVPCLQYRRALDLEAVQSGTSAANGSDSGILADSSSGNTVADSSSGNSVAGETSIVAKDSGAAVEKLSEKPDLEVNKTQDSTDKSIVINGRLEDSSATVVLCSDSTLSHSTSSISNASGIGSVNESIQGTGRVNTIGNSSGMSTSSIGSSNHHCNTGSGDGSSRPISSTVKSTATPNGATSHSAINRTDSVTPPNCTDALSSSTLPASTSCPSTRDIAYSTSLQSTLVCSTEESNSSTLPSSTILHSTASIKIKDVSSDNRLSSNAAVYSTSSTLDGVHSIVLSSTAVDSTTINNADAVGTCDNGVNASSSHAVEGEAIVSDRARNTMPGLNDTDQNSMDTGDMAASTLVEYTSNRYDTISSTICDTTDSVAPSHGIEDDEVTRCGEGSIMYVGNSLLDHSSATVAVPPTTACAVNSPTLSIPCDLSASISTETVSATAASAVTTTAASAAVSPAYSSATAAAAGCATAAAVTGSTTDCSSTTAAITVTMTAATAAPVIAASVAAAAAPAVLSTGASDVGAMEVDSDEAAEDGEIVELKVAVIPTAVDSLKTISSTKDIVEPQAVTEVQKPHSDNDGKLINGLTAKCFGALPSVIPPPLTTSAGDRATLECAEEKNKVYTISPPELTEYCKRLFHFQTITVRRYRFWRDRRKHNKMISSCRPSLTTNTKLITCPIPNRKEFFGARKREFILNPVGKSPVCVLHEYAQHTLKVQPRYVFRELENSATPFSATLLIDDVPYGTGYAISKKSAKLEAARVALEILIPEMRRIYSEGKIDQDISFFDDIKIRDPRVMDLCAKAGQLTPYQILAECLKCNYGMGDTEIKTTNASVKHQRCNFSMKVGKHEASVICKNKRDGRHLAAQAILQLMHPYISTWGSLIRLYAKTAELKEKKEEEQSVTELQTRAEPNKAILSKLKTEMTQMYKKRSAIKSTVKGMMSFEMPKVATSDLSGVDL